MSSFTPMPSLESLQEIYKIDPASPSGLSRIKATRGRNGRVGPVVSMGSDGYYRMKFDGQFYRTHRVIFFMHTGIDPAELVVDHIDGVPLNNKVENLRACTVQENTWNAKGKSKRSGLPKGITKLKNGDYRVTVMAGGRLFESDLNNFKAATNCIRAIRERNHKEFARA